MQGLSSRAHLAGRNSGANELKPEEYHISYVNMAEDMSVSTFLLVYVLFGDGPIPLIQAVV